MRGKSLCLCATGVLSILLFLQGCGGSQALPTATPTLPLTETPTPIPAPTGTPTPVPDATVNFALAQIVEGPGLEHGFVANIRAGDGLQVTGRDVNCRWLEVVTQSGESGWIDAQGGRVTLHISCETVPFGTFQPANGEILVDNRVEEGPPELKLDVSNQTSSNDGLIILTDINGKLFLGFYIRANDSVSIEGIPEGKYNLYFAIGTGWDGFHTRFAADAVYGKIQEPIAFRVIYIYNSNTTRYWFWTFSLPELSGGSYADVVVELISPEEFPVIEKEE